MLQKLSNQWKSVLENNLQKLAQDKMGSEITLPQLVIQVPPKPELGDLAFPLFAYAKVMHMAPNKIAEALKALVEADSTRPNGSLILAGPYLNIKIDSGSLVEELVPLVENEGAEYGKGKALDGQKVMIEFSCPNTNKPLHLGHMRNDSLGQSVSSLIKACGADVKKVNLINNRGVHICKSMLAYQKFGNGETPETSGEKGDHLVGKYYVRFNSWAKEDPTAETQAQEMLKKWEMGDPEVLKLWKTMNGWTLDGLAQTYDKTGISFDKYYYESNTYKLGKSEIQKGLEKGVFYKEEDGSVWIDLEDIKLDKKVLQRKDGTSLYITQDIGTAINRHEDWPFDSLIYVVASEQQYHFKVLFHVIEKLGYSWAKNLHHLSYGMVNLPNGKMKSREGTVVDADELFEQLAKMAKAEIVEKKREDQVDGVEETSNKIALGALNYYLLQVNPTKDMVFNPEESLSFSGNTGPYLQYMGARISSMLRKFEEEKNVYAHISFDGKLLNSDDERALIKYVAQFPEIVAKAGSEFDPSMVCTFLYEVSRCFSKWYHDTKILKAESKELVIARITLARMVLQVLKNSYALIGIPFLESM